MLRKNPYRHVGDDAEDLSSPPASAPVVIVLAGVALPLGIACYAVSSWIHGACVLPGSRGSFDLTGDSARAMAVVYLAVALFCNARWCWGALGFDLMHKVLTVVACLAFAGGMLATIVLAMV